MPREEDELELEAETSVTPESPWLAASAGPEYVAVNTGPAGSVERKGGVPDSMMVSWRLMESVEFHHWGLRVAEYEPVENGTDSQI